MLAQSSERGQTGKEIDMAAEKRAPWSVTVKKMGRSAYITQFTVGSQGFQLAHTTFDPKSHEGARGGVAIRHLHADHVSQGPC
jgi:hypothetical protein